MVLAWAPWVVIVAGVGYAFIVIGGGKATGLGAVVGGLSGPVIKWGLVGVIGAILISQVSAIVLLARSFSPGHWVRKSFSVLSICLSGLLVILVGLFLYLLWALAHGHF